MTIKAKVLLKSDNGAGVPICSTQITAHRWILAEINTHRVFSRSFRSSRAVPVNKLLAEVRDNPAKPVIWGSNKPGMVAGSPLPQAIQNECEEEWHLAAQMAADQAESLMNLGLHKSWANRLLEPFVYVHGIITSTEWDNFVKLRCSPDAQPEFNELAWAMHEAYDAAKAEYRDWHIPYLTPEEKEGNLDYATLSLVSAARCARVSYHGHDGKKVEIEDDLALADRLKKDGHWSPFEHQAHVDAHGMVKHHHRNFRGWAQHRSWIGG